MSWKDYRQRYLVSGCAGFIASRVVELLLEARHQVVGIDNLNDAYDPRLKQWRLAQLRLHAGFQFHELDISEWTSLKQLFELEAHPYSAVINLAAHAGVRTSVKNPWVYLQTNCNGTLNLLELCRQSNVEKFVLASTSSLYCEHNQVPYIEESDTNKPISPYAASKKAAEALAYSYHYLHGIDISILRYFSVYGPAGRPDMSIFRFIRCIAEREPIIVFGDGSQSRDFTYIEDIAKGTIASLKSFGYETFNIGGNQPFRLSYVINKIGELLGIQPIIEYRPAHLADVSTTWANIDKAHRLLGWSPEVSIEKGLQQSIDWYYKNREFVIQLDLGDRL